MDSPFQFKQFAVSQDRCAMKVGTDGVLLGAWTQIKKDTSAILDVGAGTGLIALMMAQRSQAELIDALEIDEDAYEQCTENFEASAWGDRLFCYHASLQEFVSEIEESYDLIVSNPPFYSEDPNSANPSRDMARFEDALPFEHLIVGAAHLLSEIGRLAVIIPFKEEERFIEIASECDLYPHRICRVKGASSSPLKRSLLEFSFENTTPEITELVIETARHVYTQDYINLVQDFYLKM